PVLRHLATGSWPARRPALAVSAPLTWIAPNLIAPDGDRPLNNRFVLRTEQRLTTPLLVVRQEGRVLHRQRLLPPARPGHPFHLSADWLDRADPRGDTVRVTVH
ncbi:oxidoreductase, partial [Streptomyces sp. NPDC058427]